MGIKSLCSCPKVIERFNPVVAACFAFAIFAANSPADEAPLREDVTKPTRPAPKEPPVTLRVSTTKKTFTQLEPVALTIEMVAKDGQHYLLQTNTDIYRVYDLIVTHKLGQSDLPASPTRDSQLSHLIINNRNKIGVIPGRPFRTTLYANLAYDMTYPGEYTITAQYVYGPTFIQKFEEGKTAEDYYKALPRINSEPITVTIVPLPPPAEPRGH